MTKKEAAKIPKTTTKRRIFTAQIVQPWISEKIRVQL